MARLKEQYKAEVAPALYKKFGYKSTMQIPKIDKVVVNVGCGEAKENAKVLEAVVRDLTTITGQKAVVTKAKKSIEMHPGKGAQLVRSAGTAAQLMAKENGDAQIRMPSGEVRIVRTNCMAVIGQVGNIDHENVHIGKAGRKRHMGVRPTVRGSVMNPNDHPHGGGEGKSPVGHPGPMTPWGKPAMGYKTRSKKNPTNKFIVKRRNDK